MSDPRILTGNDRTKFVTTVLNSTFNPEITDDETMRIGKKIQTKVGKLVALQKDPSHLATQSLPPMPKVYNPPVIQNRIDNARSNCFVVTNDDHSKQSINGFCRREYDGNFYCH